MSTFPALAPTSRIFSPGDVPNERKRSTGGTQYAFRRGSRRVAQALQLQYEYLTEAEMLLIKNHFYDRKGTFDIFFLSAEVWGYYTTPPVGLLDNFAWRYVSSPVITDVSYDRFNIEVSLETVPIEIGDMSFDSGLAGGHADVAYILNAGAASDVPARDYIIGGLGAQ